MKTKIVLMLLILPLIFSCSRVKKGAKDGLNKGGEVVGKAGSEFVQGVSEGVSESLKVNIKLSDDLSGNKLKTGKYLIESTSEGHNNVLSVYLIFNENIQDTLKATAFDKEGLEMGRAKALVSGKKGDAGYFDFTFDRKTKISSNSEVVIAK